jgi:hypothetical protein
MEQEKLASATGSLSIQTRLKLMVKASNVLLNLEQKEAYSVLTAYCQTSAGMATPKAFFDDIHNSSRHTGVVTYLTWH